MQGRSARRTIHAGHAMPQLSPAASVQRVHVGILEAIYRSIVLSDVVVGGSSARFVVTPEGEGWQPNISQ